MPSVKLNWTPNRKELRQFGGVFMGGFVAIGLVKYFWPFEWTFLVLSKNETVGLAMIAIGIVVGGIGLTGSGIALPLYWGWLAIAFVLGNIISRIIISLIYFLIFTPMRVLGALIGRDKLQLRKPQTDSYWLDIKFPQSAEDYEKQF